jgi:hypothetical protein
VHDAERRGEERKEHHHAVRDGEAERPAERDHVGDRQADGDQDHDRLIRGPTGMVAEDAGMYQCGGDRHGGTDRHRRAQEGPALVHRRVVEAPAHLCVLDGTVSTLGASGSG